MTNDFEATMVVMWSLTPKDYFILWDIVARLIAYVIYFLKLKNSIIYNIA